MRTAVIADGEGRQSLGKGQSDDQRDQSGRGRDVDRREQGSHRIARRSRCDDGDRHCRDRRDDCEAEKAAQQEAGEGLRPLMILAPRPVGEEAQHAERRPAVDDRSQDHREPDREGDEPGALHAEQIGDDHCADETCQQSGRSGNSRSRRFLEECIRHWPIP